MTRMGLCGLLAAMAMAVAGGGCGDDASTGNENNNNVIPGCGNGIVESDIGETCDDGDENSDTEPDACRTSCQLAGCGDGVRDNGEDCDGDDVAGTICADLPPLNHGDLTCSLDCSFDTDECYQCGDGAIDPGEECDGAALGVVDTEPANCGNVTGKPDGELACLTDCTYDLSDCALCGDGTIEGPEQCDDATDNSDQPNATCRLNCTPAGCGDGIEDDNAPRFEQCDCGMDATALPAGCNTINIDNVPNACKSDCTAPTCGDGLVDNADPLFEVCDEGAGNCDTPGCTCATNCTLPGCGNGVLEPGEVCDCGTGTAAAGCNHPNTDLVATADCNEGCKVPGCGNGYIDGVLGETCDDGTAMNCDDGSCACASNCLLPGCGNGITETYRGEECDEGGSNCDEENCTCGETCLIPRCGNGYDQDFGEQCDCGDNTQQQTCTRLNCADGSDCTCAPGCVTPGCGNGVVEAYDGEGCDEGLGNCNNPGCTCTTTCAVPWTVERAPVASNARLNAVWTDGTVALAVGHAGTVVWRDNAGNWTPGVVPGPADNLRAIWAEAANDLMVVGDNNAVWAWDGASWTNGSAYFAGVGGNFTGVACWDYSLFQCAFSADDGRIIFTMGPSVAYTNLTPFNTSQYNAIAVTVDTSSDRYLEAVGDWGTHLWAIPWAGAGWNPDHQGDTTDDLFGFWMGDINHKWMVGDDGNIFYSNGGYMSQNSNTSESLRAVTGIGVNAYAVGANGVIRRYPGTGSDWMSETALQTQGLFGVAAAGALVLAVGEQGIAVSRN